MPKPTTHDSVGNCGSRGKRRRLAAVLLSAWLCGTGPAFPRLLSAADDLPSSLPVLQRTTTPDAVPDTALARELIREINENPEAAVAALVGLLDAEEVETRELAAFLLGSLGEQSRPALPALHRVLSSNYTLVRVQAAEAIVKIDPHDHECVKLLVESLEDPNPQIRAKAAVALGYVSPAYQDVVVPALQRTLHDPASSVRKAVETTYPLLRPSANVAADTATDQSDWDKLFKAPLPTKDAPTVEPATTVFAPEMQPGPEQPVADAPEAAASDAMQQPAPAGAGLPEIGASPTASEVASEEASGQPTASQEPAAPESLSQAAVEEADPAAERLPVEVAFLVEHLNSPDPAHRKRAVNELGWQGVNARVALPELLECLNDDDPLVRAHAAKAVHDIAPDASEPAIAALTELVDSVQPGVRPMAAYFLGEFGPKATPALPTLQRALGNCYGLDHMHLAESILRIDPTDAQAASVLINALGDPDEEFRFFAACALQGTAPHQFELIAPALSAARGDASPRVAAAANLALETYSQVQPVELAQGKATVVVPPAPEEIPGRASVQLDEELPIDAWPAGENVKNKPITAVTIHTAPRRRDAEGRIQPLPVNYGAAFLEQQGQEHHVIGTSRPWMIEGKVYTAPAFCHRPLYFEEENLERYGHRHHAIQPFVSAAHFYGRLPIMPYLATVDHMHDCQYPLGKYRPGSCAPYQHQLVPFQLDAALVQTGAIVLPFYIID